jgi:hypothetical protein
MIVSRKAALSLLISTLLFAVFVTLAFTGLFNLVEVRFYNPAVVRAIGREIDADARVIENFFEELRIRFAATLEEGAVRRSLLAGLEDEDIARRESLYRELLESLAGLQSVRLIDSGGRRIQFSTWEPDILRRDRDYIAYRNYDAEENGAAHIPYRQIEATAPRLILDDTGERIVFSLPYYDSFDVYRGTALFSLSVRAVMDRLVSVGRIKAGEDVSVVSKPPGLVAGLPFAGRDVLLPLVARMWSENSLSLGRLNAGLTGPDLALVSRKTTQNIYIGRLVSESLLTFPPAMRIILLVSLFITMYLVIFLFFNFRQDDMTILQSRLRKLQIRLLEEHYEHTGDLNWDRWKQELEHRREDIRPELKRGLRSGVSVEENAEIDAFIDRSWDDLMAIIGAHRERLSGIDEAMLRALLNRLSPETTAAPRAALAAKTETPEKTEALNEADVVEALEGPIEERTPPDSPEPEQAKLEIAEPDIPELEAVEVDLMEEPETLELEAVEPDMTEEPEAPPELEAVEPELPEELETPELEAMELDLTEEPEAPSELEAVEPELSEEPEAPSGLEVVEPDLTEGPETPPELEPVAPSGLEAVEPELPEELETPELEAVELNLTEELEAPSELEVVEPDLPEGPETPSGLEAVEPELPEERETPELEAVELNLTEVREAPSELEAVELDLTEGPETPPELEPVELDLTEKLEAPSGLEAVEPDLTEGPETPSELEVVEPDLTEEPEAAAKFHGVDLLFEDSGYSMTMDDLISAIEFGPEPPPQEFEQENENILDSLAESFDFKSPASIFSSLSGLAFTPEPMEDLEFLERERTEPEDSPETEAEELRLSFVGPQFFAPFMGAPDSELPLLMAEDEDASAAPEEPETPLLPAEAATGDIITERDGVAYVSKTALAPDRETARGLDKNFKNLIDSVLNDT